MASATLDDITAEMMVSNETLGYIRSDTQMMSEYLDLTVDTMKDSFNLLIAAMGADALSRLEEMKEQKKWQEDVLGQLKLGNKKEQGSTDAPEMEVTGIMALIVGGLATAWGMLKAQLAAIKLFANQFTPKSIKAIFAGMRKRVLGMVMGAAMRINLIVNDVRDVIGKAMTTFKNFFVNTFANFGKTKIGGAIAGAFKSAGKWIMAFVDPLIDAFKMIKGWVSGSGAIGKMGSYFKEAGKLFSKLGGIFRVVATVAKKIFLPITILMSVFDTISESLSEGKTKGAMGYLSGALKGLVSSLITKPLDLLKSGVAWLLGKFGFDGAKDTLESFSFDEMYRDLIDGIFKVVDKAIEWLKLLFTDPKKALKQMWDGLMEGVASIGDWIAKQIDKAVTWVMSKLGIENDFGTEGDEFSIKEEISKLWEKIKTWFKEKLDAITPDFMKSDKPLTQIRTETQQRAEMFDEFGGDAYDASAPMRIESPTTQALDKAQAENNKLGGKGTSVVVVNQNIDAKRVDASTNTNGTAIIANGGNVRKLSVDEAKKMN